MPRIREVYKTATVTIFEISGEFYVYSDAKLIRVCPSIGMAHEVASGY